MVKTSHPALVDFLEPITASLNEESARKLVGARASPKLQARIDRLARKCNEGKLTSDERTEYETYVLAGNVVAILQAKARLMLTKRDRRA